MGSIKTSAAGNPGSEVVLFDSETIIPKDMGNYSPAQASLQENQKFSQLTQKRPGVITNARNVLVSWGLDASKVVDIDDVVKLAEEGYFLQAFHGNPQAENLFENYWNQLVNWATNLVPVQNSNDELAQKLRVLARTDPLLVLTGSESRIFSHEIFEKTNVSAFQQEFAKIFTDYRKKLVSNVAKQLDGTDQILLTEEQFEQRFGPKPWDFVNEILELSKLDFRINHPVLSEPYGSFETRLTKVSTGVEMRFADLSSGERVLMSFALCLYNSSENTGATTFPKLLLLDEIDAPLHPDMVKFVLNTVREVLVKKHQIAVILTTHSPTTVALFEENGIFEMNTNGPSLEKTTKDRALSILTAGVPTVSVSYNQINQVFVESETDAVVLSYLYQAMKSSLTSLRSVQFIKSGRKSGTGNEENAGCARVKSVVQDLRSAGVKTVFGLIDWDGKNSSEEGILVLCEGTRYSIENLILDPVLLIATLAKEFTDFAKTEKFLVDGETFVGLANWTESRWQAATDKLMLTLGMEAEAKVTVEYRNGMKLKFARSYLEQRGHNLVDLVCDKVPPLLGKRRQGELESSIVRNVVPEVKDLLPCEVLTLFEKLTVLGPH